MSTEQPRTPDLSVLGESWVVASDSSIKERSTEDDGSRELEPAIPGPDPRGGDGAKINDASESLRSSAWSIQGPELVMPSIYEVAVSEASWVAPEVRSTNVRPPAHAMRKRRKTSTSDKDPLREQRQSDTVAENKDAGTSTPAQNTDPESRGVSLLAKLAANCGSPSPLFRTLINAVLVAGVLHLLVFPELVYQARDLCLIPAVPSLYPSSCMPVSPGSPPNTPFHYQSKSTNPKKSIVAAQTRLESILDTSLQSLTPLSDTLKQSENILRDLQYQAKTAFPDVQNALTLEFQGSNQAVRAAAWEFGSLRADLRSAVDSLRSTAPVLEAGGGSVARDTRMATQLRRREQYLDRLRAQIRSKAESLGSRLTTLDDHLEAVAGIVTREQRRMGADLPLSANAFASRDNRNVLLSLLDSLQHLGAFFFGPRSSSSSFLRRVSDEPVAIGNLLRQAAGHHKAVADSARRLSRQLRDAERV